MRVEPADVFLLGVCSVRSCVDSGLWAFLRLLSILQAWCCHEYVPREVVGQSLIFGPVVHRSYFGSSNRLSLTFHRGDRPLTRLLPRSRAYQGDLAALPLVVYAKLAPRFAVAGADELARASGEDLCQGHH